MYTLGYLVPAVERRQGDRRRRRRSSRTSATPRASTASIAKIRFGHRVERASWSSDDARWTVDGASAPTPASRSRFTCGFLFMCTGYYDYDEGYTPEFPGTERFRGRDRPPAEVDRRHRLRRQARRRDRQRRDRGDARARAGEARRARDDAAALADVHHVAARRGPDRGLAARARCRAKRRLRDRRAGRTCCSAMAFFQLCRRRAARRRRGCCSRQARRRCRRLDVETHFTPTLQPVGPAPLPRARRRSVRGDQRRHGVGRDRSRSRRSPRRASSCESGEELEADLVVTATGLKLLAARRHAARRRRRATSTSPRPSATRA